MTAPAATVDVPYVVGERLLLGDADRGADAREEASRRFVWDLDVDLRIPGRPPLGLGVPVVLWVGSVEYSLQNLHLAAEYSRWNARVESNDTTLVPPFRAVSERGYAMASYQVSDWFHPGVYYSLYYPDVKRRSGRGDDAA